MFIRTFALTWMIYCGYYLCRKNLSVLLPYLKIEQEYTSAQLANVLFAFSVAYALGQFLMGTLNDRFGARLVVTMGALSSSIASALIGVGPLVVVQSANGIAQAAGWPGVLKLAREWFPEHNRAVVMGWWGTHLVVGGFLGTALATTVAQSDWRQATWIPALCLAALALIFALLIRNGADCSPTDIAPSGGFPVNRAIIAIAVMYFFVKLTRYAFLFWLPLYMSETLAYSPTRAGYASLAFEFVGFGGVLAAGYAAETFRRSGRFAIAAIMMFGLAVLCVSYPHLSRIGFWSNIVAMSLIGAFTFGPDTLMAGAATQEASPPGATARAGGFVNGVGSLGQIVSPLVVSRLSDWLGWPALFACLGAAAFLGGVALLPEWKRR